MSPALLEALSLPETSVTFYWNLGLLEMGE